LNLDVEISLQYLQQNRLIQLQQLDACHCTSTWVKARVVFAIEITTSSWNFFATLQYIVTGESGRVQEYQNCVTLFGCGETTPTSEPVGRSVHRMVGVFSSCT
jgi:hypothetical protein